MEPRENDRIIPLAVLHTLDKVLQDIQQTVRLQDLIPHIVCRIVGIPFNRRIGRTDIERQEVGVSTGQFCGHEHQVVVHDKVHQAGIQHPVAGIAVRLVLNDAVLVTLSGPLVLQLARNNGNTINQDAEIELVVLVARICGILHLTHYRKAVLSVQPIGRRLLTANLRLEFHKLHLGPHHHESLVEHIPDAGATIDGPVVGLNNRVYFPAGDITGKFGPYFRLGLHKAFKHLAVAEVFDFEIAGLTLVIEVRVSEHVGDVLFEAGFV